MTSRNNQVERLFLLKLSGDFAPHILQSAVRRFVRSSKNEVIFPMPGKIKCHILFRGTEVNLKALVDWLEQMPCGLRHLEKVEIGEADNFVSALKGDIRPWR